MNSVHKYREANKMTQQDVAEKLRVSVSLIQKIEYGHYPNVVIALNLAKLFNTTVEKLFHIS